MSDMALKPTVAISDGFLAAASLYAGFRMVTTGSYPTGLPFGLFITAIAACLGVCRFGLDTRVIPVHQAMYCVTISIGVPFLMVSLACVAGSWTHYQEWIESMLSGKPLLIAVVAGLIFVAALSHVKLMEQLCGLVLVASVIVALVACTWHRHTIGVIVVLLYLLSGIVGAKGATLGVLNVNWLHYILCVANLATLYV